MKYAFIHKQRTKYSVGWMCAKLGISRSGYYKWLNSGDSKRHAKRVSLLQRITEIFEYSKRSYGVPRVYRQLRKEGYTCNHKTVEKLMRQHGLKARRKRRFRSTTDSKHSMPIAPNVLEREFTAQLANEVWVGDITYIDTKEGWLYLAVFIDLYTRRIVGWSMDSEMTADLVLDAFRMGEKRYCSPILVHSDRGSQYAAELFRAELEKAGSVQSMSRKGNCWDNAVAESFFGSLKSEVIYHQVFETRMQAQTTIFEYIEIWYNKRRLHSTLNYLTPDEFALKCRKVA